MLGFQGDCLAPRSSALPAFAWLPTAEPASEVPSTGERNEAGESGLAGPSHMGRVPSSFHVHPLSRGRICALSAAKGEGEPDRRAGWLWLWEGSVKLRLWRQVLASSQLRALGVSSLTSSAAWCPQLEEWSQAVGLLCDKEGDVDRSLRTKRMHGAPHTLRRG